MIQKRRSQPLSRKCTKEDRVVRKRLADGSVKEYRYPRVRAEKVGRYGANTLGALIVAYKRSPEWKALSPSTKAGKSLYLKPLEEVHQLDTAKLRRRQIIAIRDGIADLSGNGAAGKFISAARTLMAWAISRDWIENNPAAEIKALPGGSLRAWTNAEADHAIANLPQPYRRAVILARYTGQRRGDLIRLTWSAYDGHALRLRQQKSGKSAPELVIPIPAALKAELGEWRKSTASTHILTSVTGRPWVATHLTNALPRELQKIGLDRGLNIHGLRKLAATSLAEAGCTVHQIAAITGHRTLSMVELYTRSVDQKNLAESAVAQLETRILKLTKTS
jgi:integrase